MKTVKYSSLSKKFYERVMNDNDTAVKAIVSAIYGIKQSSSNTNITDEEIQVLNRAMDILINNIGDIEDYIETVEQFYNADEVEMD